MTRFNWLAMVATVVFVGGGFAEDKKPEEKKEPAKFDAEKLVGNWTITEMTKRGDKVDLKEKKEVVVFAKDTIKVKGEMGDFEFKYTMDAKADPVVIDMEITAPEGFKGAKAKGILKMDGEKLWLTYDADPESKAAPKAFESKKDTQVFSYALTKAKAEKKEDKK